MLAGSVEYIAHYLKEKGLDIRVIGSIRKPPRIYVRDNKGNAQFQLIFWRGDRRGEIDIRVINCSVKTLSYNAAIGLWLYKSSKKKLFTINLYSPASISKLDEWLEENKSKLL